MIKAVIFDMDGVIIDSELLWGKAVEEQNKKLSFTAKDNGIYKKLIITHLRGRSQREGIILYKNKFNLPQSYKTILDERLEILFKIFDRELKTMPGAIQLIKKLHQRYPLMLTSSSPKKVIQYVLNRYNLNKYFKFKLSGDDFKKGKPHPEIYLKSAHLLKTKPSQILVFEDSVAGVQSALRAGLKCIALKQPYTPYKYLSKTNLVIKSLKQVNLQTIKKL